MYNLAWFFLNVIITNIPFWPLRKLIFCLFGMKIGKSSRIGMKTIIQSPWNLKIGSNSIINEFCFIDARGGINIGNNVSISYGSKIVTASHKLDDDNFEYFEESVAINNNCWLGLNAIILNGSIIRTGSVIGSGSVFKGKTEEYMIYIGNPAKPLKKRKLSEDFKLDITYSLI